jgi:hypothetical protein
MLSMLWASTSSTLNRVDSRTKAAGKAVRAASRVVRAVYAKAARVASRVNANVCCTANAPGRGRGFFFVHREES